MTSVALTGKIRPAGDIRHRGTTISFLPLLVLVLVLVLAKGHAVAGPR